MVLTWVAGVQLFTVFDWAAHQAWRCTSALIQGYLDRAEVLAETFASQHS